MGKASKDKRDAYYRLAKEQGWRARSAFKLLQLNEEFNLFDGVTRVVDLCAAPGSWSQVLSRVLIQGETFGPEAWQVSTEEPNEQSQALHGSKKDEVLDKDDEDASARRRDVNIVAIDLQPITPLKGITTLTADITHSSTIPMLLQALDPDVDNTSSGITSRPVDLVLSDGAPDVIGLHDFDAYIQTQLLFAALNVALCVLKPGGTFVSKIFRTKDVDITYAQLRVLFNKVAVAKPRSSRASSVEAFVVCQDFHPPSDLEFSLEKSMLGPASKPQAAVERFWRDTPKQPPARTVREDGVIELDLGQDEGGDDDGEQDDPRVPRWIAPFVVCGDPSLSYDSDTTYRLPKDRQSLDPVQPPTAPPYKRALEMRRAAGGAYGKTKNKKTDSS